MDFDIREIRKYYGSEIREYDFDKLVNVGITRENADFMIDVGVPEEFADFVFYGFDDFQKLLFEDVQVIKIGHFSFCEYGLYLKESSNEFFTSSSYHEPQIYMLNKNLRTFFLFHLIRNKVAMKMMQQGEFTSYNYAIELRRLYGQIDPVAMKDVEGYWSHLIEDYETGL
ncbi:hypothetical protein HPY31_18960 [Brevibacillus sp. HB1.3]|uniref:hypothetical protein n=1 Tax=Brevibacillus sp. HB1.3 TaxID=2738842 RepID=UPI001553D220|nr:hypothetical protein [Brevibacillus sp. HB1.3]NQF15979.1 hypothetical protein [Brevibacillus sp. HB1.3]